MVGPSEVEAEATRSVNGLEFRVGDEEVAAAVAALGENAPHVDGRDWPGALTGIGLPGMYSWRVDPEGADSLTLGLSLPLAAGRIYAGQAGATAWPSGTKRAATLATRIGGNHLRGTIRGSTFRLTLAAVLRLPLGLKPAAGGRLTRDSEGALTAWMRDHLAVAVYPFPDAGRLGDLEVRALATLDPPLNLEGMARTPVRERLSLLRRALTVATRVATQSMMEPPKRTPTGEGGRVTLHEELEDILRTHGKRWMSTQELADEVNRRGRYRKRDGSPVDAFQVHGRTKNYPAIFERQVSQVRLR